MAHSHTPNKTPMNRLPIVVLISGSGTNLQAIIDASQSSTLPVDIRAVISNRKTAYGLLRAQNADIPTAIIQTPRHLDYSDILLTLLDRYAPKLVVLAGFMKRIPARVVTAYAGRMINIHPSLLPKYPGLHTHRQVLENRDLIHGSTVHVVTNTLDGGPRIAYSQLQVSDQDTETSLTERIKRLEHRLYPEVIRWFAEGRLRMTSDQMWLDGQLISPTGVCVS